MSSPSLYSEHAFAANRTSRRALCAIALLSSLALGACSSDSKIFDMSSLGEKPAPQSNVATGSVPRTDLEKATEYWGKQVAEHPGDAQPAINYIRNLKALGAKTQALQVAQSAYSANPGDKRLASEYGRLALEQDQLSLAERLLEQADNPVAPDWKTIMARGTVLAKQSKYREAIAQFERARALAPDQPSVLNNLALAYAMDGHADKAEPLLRQAAQSKDADAKVPQNLALVLGLLGRTDEAKNLAVRTSSPKDAEDDAEFVKDMVGAKVAVAQPGKPPVIAAVATTPAKAASAKRADKQAATDAYGATDASVLVQRMADSYSAVPADQPLRLTPTK